VVNGGHGASLRHHKHQLPRLPQPLAHARALRHRPAAIVNLAAAAAGAGGGALRWQPQRLAVARAAGAGSAEQILPANAISQTEM
jgi:hypothetical protein